VDGWKCHWNLKRKNDFRISAYMTVEASLIMPMVLCICVILIYVSFFLYDRCCFSQDAYVLCFRESIRREEGTPTIRPDKIKENEQRQFGSKYFAVSSLETTASADGKNCVYEGTAKVLPTSFGSYFLMPRDIWEATFHSSARKTDPSWSIRSVRRKTYMLTKIAES
jgi:hypothetical protein